MAATVIWGNELASKFREEMKLELEGLKKEGIEPGLTVVIVGEDPASKSYVKAKSKACEQIGIRSKVIELPADTTEQEVVTVVQSLNKDETVHGILVQLPLPKQIREEVIIETISPEKDVDGFHPTTIGKMLTGQDTFFPCTPFGIVKMVQSQNIPIEGKHVVVVGRSNIVGKPVGQLFLNENATVTYCHSRTKNLKEITRQADILIVAVGRIHMITAEYVKEGAVVIDVGVNRKDDGKLTGDVDFASVEPVASYITPVPKGVGPMTITMLLHNTIKAARLLEQKERIS
ncbi:bifunctional methylenetetrahydrofolate dehydrogenase/methenyltetrahydrofolate cyclohydrolase FolD [Bacillaceae bacterium S4-13-56]